jgi:curved DNA-binding protein CbpA
MKSTLPNHYQTLRVRQDASKEQIQASFRRLVKVYHPDKNPGRTSWAKDRMVRLLQAYEVLSDDRERYAYDRRLSMNRPRMSFADRMKSKPWDLGAQSKLILHYLLEGKSGAAVQLHEKLLLRRATFSLANHLDERDYLDSLFLLGEAYEERRQWRTALRFYWEAYQHEQVGPRKRYFFEELKDRLRVLFSQRLVRGLSPEDALKNYRRALALGIDNREAAIVYKKIAAVQKQLGRRDEAVRALDKAKTLCPGMKNIDTLREKIAGH